MRPWVPIVCAALLPTAAWGQSFHAIAQNSEGAAFLDGKTIKSNGQSAVAAVTLFLFFDLDDRTAYELIHDEIDCKASRIRHIDEQGFDVKGTSTHSTKSPSDWTAVTPGSNQTLEQQLVCNPDLLAKDAATNVDPSTMLESIRAAELKLDASNFTNTPDAKALLYGPSSPRE